MNEKIIWEFPKNTREVVRAIIKTWNARELIDIRVYYLAKDNTLRPGPKGLCLQSEKLPDLSVAISKLETELLRYRRENETA